MRIRFKARSGSDQAHQRYLVAEVEGIHQMSLVLSDPVRPLNAVPGMWFGKVVCLRAPPTISAFCAYVGWQISEFETSDEEALLKIRLVRPPPGTGGEDSDVRVPLRGYARKAPQPRARFNDLQERFWYSLRRSSQAKSTRRSWRSSRFDIADIAGSSSVWRQSRLGHTRHSGS